MCPKQTCLKLPLSIFQAPRMLFDRDVAVWEREREHLAPLHYKEQQRAKTG